MERYVYIQKDTREIYVELDGKIDENTSPVGTTWEDYVDGAWLLLSAEQVAFSDAHPDASVQEVFNMRLNPVPQPPPPPQRTLADAIREKIVAIDAYDHSDSVNSFTINGVDTWIPVDQRAYLKGMIDALKSKQETSVEVPLLGQFLTLPVAVAEDLLSDIEIYAPITPPCRRLSIRQR
jgi:hypothetical protein